MKLYSCEMWGYLEWCILIQEFSQSYRASWYYKVFLFIQLNAQLDFLD